MAEKKHCRFQLAENLKDYITSAPHASPPLFAQDSFGGWAEGGQPSTKGKTARVAKQRGNNQRDASGQSLAATSGHVGTTPA